MLSLVIRRIHLYTALFLGPWVLMYAVSTFAMNHRAWFRGREAPPPRFEKLREFVYDGSFPAGAGANVIARQLLVSLDLDGAHAVGRPSGNGEITIQRFDAVRPLRIRYRPAERLVTVERQNFEAAAFLERLHRRRGYQHDYWRDDIWAVSVDVVIAAIVVWTLSGVWMWWEMKATRRWGFAFLLGGLGIFGAFLVVLG